MTAPPPEPPDAAPFAYPPASYPTPAAPPPPTDPPAEVSTAPPTTIEAIGQFATPVAQPEPYRHGQPPAPALPARHAAEPPPAAYAQPYAPQFGQAALAAQAPYGGVPGMVLPPNYTPYLSPTRRVVGIAGLVIGFIGAGLVLLSFLTLTWLSGGNGFGTNIGVKFSDLHDEAKHDAPAIPTAYFSWLGWALLVAVAVFVLLGNLPTATHPLWRVVGILTGLAGSVLTFLAIYNGNTTIHDVVKFGDIGFWLAIAGFFVAAIGAVIGPRRVRN